MYDLYYARNIFSLLVCLSLAGKNKKKKILVINNGTINKSKLVNLKHKYFKKINKFIKDEFNSVYYFNSIHDLKQKNMFLRVLERSKKIKKYRNEKIFSILKKLDIDNIYSSNDDFDASIYPFFKQKKFHYLEHGIGNFINSIELSTKRKLFYFYLRLLFFIKLSNYYPIKYQNYFSILSNKKIKFQYVNGFKTKSINLSNFQNILEFISKKIKLKKIKNKKKNILLNFSNFEENTPLIEIKKVIDKILKKSNKKKYNYIIKDHTRREPHKKNKKFVMSILKKENVSVVTLTNKIPAELVAKYYDCKKMFSLQSSLPYHYSKIDKNCDINIFFNISMKYPSKNVWFVGKANLFSINWYKNYFNNINFF